MDHYFTVTQKDCEVSDIAPLRFVVLFVVLFIVRSFFLLSSRSSLLLQSSRMLAQQAPSVLAFVIPQVSSGELELAPRAGLNCSAPKFGLDTSRWPVLKVTDYINDFWSQQNATS